MAKLGIFTGTSANDTTGDTLAQGAVKINSNFSEIYTALGDGTNITNSLLSITVAGLSTFTNGPILVGSGIQTGTSKLQVSGDTFITGSVGIGTTNPSSNLHVIGDGRFTGVVTALSFSGNASSAGYAVTAGIATYATNAGTSTSVIGGIGSITQLQVTGISTFTNGPVLIGGGTSTGTTGQVLQITGISSGVYVGGSVGIGTTNPTESLHVQGNLKVTGTITGEVSSIVATARTSTNVIGGIGSITQLQVGPGITTVGFLTATSAYIGIATVGFLTATNIFVSGVSTSGGVVVTTSNDYKIGVNTVLNSTTLGSGVTSSSLTSVGTLRQLSVSSTGITTVGFITAASAYVSGVITATTFSSGIATETVGFTTSTISGPPTIYISPYKVGISSGTVRIVGNLIVEGSTTTETQATIQTSSKTIGVAVSFVDNILLDGAGIGIGSTSIQKTLFWNYGSSALKSSENFNLASGKVYQINDNQVLSSTALAPSVTTASGITSVGTLQQLIVSSNSSSDAVRITQVGSGNALIVEDSANPDGTAFIVSSDGSVGIGTTVPVYKLTITNNALPTSGLTNAIADFTGSVDGYTQLNIRNSLAAASASSDLIATADTGSDTTNFIDLGINNSAFSSGSWTVNGALDGYLYTSDGSLSIGIGTTNTAKYLSFFAGGLLAANEQVRINQTGVGIGTTNPTSKLHVAGNVRITGVSTLGVTSATNLTSQQLNVSGITTVGFITATNAYIGVATVGFITATNIWVSGVTTTQTLNVGTGGTVIITTSSGSVGIGTTNPTFALDIFSTSNNSNGILRVRSQYATAETAIGDNFIKFNYSGGSSIDFVSSLNFRDSSFNPILYLQNSTKNVLINTSTETGTANQFLQVSGGAAFYGTGSSVGIGTTNPTSKLHVQGDAYITGVTTSTDFNSTSDIKLKTNIHQIDDSLAKVIQIRGVTFNWKDTNRSSAGVIAQEVEKVLPELVNGEETKTVNYNGVIGALVEAVKELKVENDVLRERLDEVYKKVFG